MPITHLIYYISQRPMATQNTAISVKERKAMWEKLQSSSSPPASQKKQTVVNPLKAHPNIPKGVGEVQSPPIVKPRQIQQQSNSLNNPNSPPTKLGSLLANNPWVQQNNSGNLLQKNTSPPWVKQNKPENQVSPTFKHASSAPESTKFAVQKMVKITENAVVDKESLPSQNAMKLLFEGKLIGIKKTDQSPKKPTISAELRQGPKQAPVIQTDLKLGSVKENANKFNNFYQARESQKQQAQLQEAKRKKEAEELSAQRQKLVLKQTESETIEQILEQKNSTNVQPMLLSQPEQTATLISSNTLNVTPGDSVEQSIPIGESESKAERNSLMTKLVKRKKELAKCSFDSDED